MADYDIEKAFRAVENELIKSMIRNMKRHRIEEIDEKKEWEMWQALQLKSLEKYKRENKKKFKSKFSQIDAEVEAIIDEAREQGNMDQEIKILKAIQKGYKPHIIPPKIKGWLENTKGRSLKEKIDVLLRKNIHTQTNGEFFKINTRKLDALIKATQNDFKKAEYAMLRMSEDQYRKVIFNAQVYANTGAGTYEKAVDMATKDYLSRGINCIEYSNSARHTIADYADMAIRTAAKRAYLVGEGEKRNEWGITTVIMNKRGNACPKCLPFVGKVLIDDVWSGGKQSDGPYMLMSYAMEKGLYHPRCKDAHTTYFEGISSPGASYTKDELKKIENDYRDEQKQQYAKRQAERFGRLAEYSLDEENRKKYQKKENQWKNIVEKHSNSDIIKLTDDEQYALNQYLSFESYKINEKLRNGMMLSTEEKKMVDNLDSALKKMPCYEGDLSRSLYFGEESAVKNYIKKFNVDDEISFEEFISTTCGSELYNPEGEIQIFIENTKSGRNLTSINKKELEVLYERSSKFKVKNIVERDGKYWILMEEV